jgi:PAS domain S-box-containing protein
VTTPERDERFERLFEDSDDPIFVVDPLEDQILDANRAACAMLGYTHAELLATPVSWIHPAELPELSAFVAGVVREREGQTIRLTCRTKSGVFLPTETALLARDNGGRLYIFWFVIDRSEHRQAPVDGA